MGLRPGPKVGVFKNFKNVEAIVFHELQYSINSVFLCLARWGVGIVGSSTREAPIVSYFAELSAVL